TRFSRDWSSDVCSSDLNHYGKKSSSSASAYCIGPFPQIGSKPSSEDDYRKEAPRASSEGTSRCSQCTSSRPQAEEPRASSPGSSQSSTKEPCASSSGSSQSSSAGSSESSSGSAQSSSAGSSESSSGSSKSPSAGSS